MWGREGNRAGPKVEEKKVEPNFGLSGALAEETNTVNNVALVYTEPPEAANPTLRWRLYTFKGGLYLSPLPLSQSQHTFLPLFFPLPFQNFLQLSSAQKISLFALKSWLSRR